MTQRINSRKLQRFQCALRTLIAAVHDARQRYPKCQGLKARRFSGLSRFVREILALPHSQDLAVFEVQLKRRLVQAQARLNGRQPDLSFSLRELLPAVYTDVLQRYDEEARELLRMLGDVDIRENHQHLKPVHELI